MDPDDRVRVAARRTCFAVLQTAALIAVPLLAAGSASATDWWVDGKSGNNNNAGSFAKPVYSFTEAQDRAKPGDTIYLKPTTTYNTLYLTKDGTSTRPLTISGGGGNVLTKVDGGSSRFGIWIGASNVVVANFDVTTQGSSSAIHAQEGQHHLTITGNRAHDAGGNGISMVGNDYVTISDNVVYGNANVTAGNVFASGISVKWALDIDNYTGVKFRITGNTVYNNTNVPNCSNGDKSCWAKASDSDGNGIIIDNNRRTTADNIWYRGRTLIANNVVFGNGGRGIHMYLSDHVSVNSNTLYSNNQDPYEGNYRPGEVTGDYVSDVSVYNNVAYSDGGQGRNSGAFTGTHVPISFMYCSGLGQIIISGNLGYRPQNDSGSFFVGRSNDVPVQVYGNLWGDPNFVRRSLDPDKANFEVKSGSRALNNGLDQYMMQYDILGISRGTSTSIGAYEYSGS